jgi:hypothetical protein
VGDFVDYWNDRRWKGGLVMNIITDSKGEKTIRVQQERFHS